MLNILATLGRIYTKVVKKYRSCQKFLAIRKFLEKLQKIVREIFPDVPTRRCYPCASSSSSYALTVLPATYTLHTALAVPPQTLLARYSLVHLRAPMNRYSHYGSKSGHDHSKRRPGHGTDAYADAEGRVLLFHS
jgi:hypothetical protein